jgi:hypothetical protein
MNARAKKAETAAAAAAAVEPAAVEQWVGAREAMRRFSVGFQTLRRLARENPVCRRMTAAGTEYDADLLAQLCEVAELEQDEQSVHVESHKQTLAALKLAHEQASKMFEPYAKATALALDLLAKNNEQLATRCTALERTNLEVIQAREALLSQNTERELAGKAAQAAVDMKQKTFGLLLPSLQKLSAQAFGVGGVPAGLPPASDVASRPGSEAVTEANFEQLIRVPEVRAKVAATLELLGQMEPAKLEALLGSGLLTASEEQCVRRVIGKPTNGAHSAEQDKGAPSAETTNAAGVQPAGSE